MSAYKKPILAKMAWEHYDGYALVSEATRQRKIKRGYRPTERQIRALRYIWMRGNLTTADLPSLNWVNLGGLVCRRLLVVMPDPRAKLIVTELGKAVALGKIIHLKPR